MKGEILACTVCAQSYQKSLFDWQTRRCAAPGFVARVNITSPHCPYAALAKRPVLSTLVPLTIVTRLTRGKKLVSLLMTKSIIAKSALPKPKETPSGTD